MAAGIAKDHELTVELAAVLAAFGPAPAQMIKVGSHLGRGRPLAVAIAGRGLGLQVLAHGDAAEAGFPGDGPHREAPPMSFLDRLPARPAAVARGSWRFEHIIDVQAAAGRLICLLVAVDVFGRLSIEQ